MECTKDIYTWKKCIVMQGQGVTGFFTFMNIESKKQKKSGKIETIETFFRFRYPPYRYRLYYRLSITSNLLTVFIRVRALGKKILIAYWLMRITHLANGPQNELQGLGPFNDRHHCINGLNGSERFNLAKVTISKPRRKWTSAA